MSQCTSKIKSPLAPWPLIALAPLGAPVAPEWPKTAEVAEPGSGRQPAACGVAGIRDPGFQHHAFTRAFGRPRQRGSRGSR